MPRTRTIRDPFIAAAISGSLRNLRKRKYPGWGGQCAAAGDFGVSAVLWNHWETGVTVPSDMNQRKLAQFFNVTLAELRGDPTLEIPSYPSSHWISVVSTELTSDGHILECRPAPPERPCSHIAITPGTVAIQVSGSSAQPVAVDGQYVLVRESGREPKIGDLVVVYEVTSSGDRILFKRWLGYHKGLLVLVSINPVYPTVLLKRKQVRTAQVIIGTVYEYAERG